MKKISAILLLIVASFTTQAQIKAITEKGDEVLLNENGTWSYLNGGTEAPEVALETNPNEFKKDAGASFLVKSDRIPVGVHVNPKLWSFKKAAEGEASEYEFQRKNEDLYVLLITEKIEIPVESLKGLAFENAQSVAPDAKIVAQEYRIVNGVKILMMQMEGTIQGVTFRYFGYYYSGPEGSVQLLSYTSSNLFEGYKNDMEKFLNGFVLTDKK